MQRHRAAAVPTAGHPERMVREAPAFGLSPSEKRVLDLLTDHPMLPRGHRPRGAGCSWSGWVGRSYGDSSRSGYALIIQTVVCIRPHVGLSSVSRVPSAYHRSRCIRRNGPPGDLVVAGWLEGRDGTGTQTKTGTRDITARAWLPLVGLEMANGQEQCSINGRWSTSLGSLITIPSTSVSFTST